MKRLLFPALLAVLQGCSPSGPVDGAVAFQKCASCHAVGPNAHGAFGPQLNGLFGRRAGATPDYAYCAASRTPAEQSGIV
jgi:cytochrome c